MSTPTDLAKFNVHEFADRFRRDVIPLSNAFSYFCAAPMGEEDLKDYLEEPVAALPPAVQTVLPRVSIFLVPYLEKTNGKTGEIVAFDKPAEKAETSAAQFTSDSEAVLVLAIKDREVAEYHYGFYRAVATLLADHVPVEVEDSFLGLLREELINRIHGEVDEQGWQLKQSLLRRQSNMRRETKLFRAYARQALIDTLTLYLHGICCDIDVETGPRQLPSRFLRRRLELLHNYFPPPQGYAVFPEEASRA
ncbi:MAG: hypothetical protein AAB225_32125 [Acidobacteriota bacterium]